MRSVLMLSQEVHPIPPTKGAAVEQWIDAVAHRCTRYAPLVASVVHPDRPDEEICGNVRYKRIRMGRLYKRLFRKISRLDPWSHCDRIISFAKIYSPAIVHIHNAPQFVDAFRRGLPAAKLILHMHNEKECEFSSHVDALIGCSRYIENWFSARNINAGYLGSLPNGVDTQIFIPTTFEQRLKIRTSLGLPVDRFIVLYSGRISPEKGPDLLLDAFSTLDSHRFHCVLAGEWPQGDPSTSQRVAYANTLRQKSAGLALTQLGSRTPASMVEIYQAADLLVIPSRFEEPFSMAAIEAMACGLPVLALAKGGMVEYMRHEENAFLLPPQAGYVELASAIRELSSNVGKLDHLRAKGRNLVVESFDWHNVATQAQELYDQLIGAQA